MWSEYNNHHALSHEAVLQNYDIIDVWLSVFSYAITLELLNLLLCLLAWSEWLLLYTLFSGYNIYILIKMNVNVKYVNS